MDFIAAIIQQIQNLFKLWSSSDHSDSGKAMVSTLASAKAADNKIEQAPAPAPSVPKPGVIVKPKFCLPVEPLVTSLFGWRVLGGQRQWHPGLDMACWQTYGTPVKACEAGTVILNKQSPTPDKLTFVVIRGDLTGCFLYYCHTGSKENTVSPLVAVGQHVECGQNIGYSNSTGMTTGPHTHMGCYDKNWVCVDFGLYLKKYAPELFAQLINYRCTNELDPSNKTGRPEAGL